MGGRNNASGACGPVRTAILLKKEENAEQLLALTSECDLLFFSHENESAIEAVKKTNAENAVPEFHMGKDSLSFQKINAFTKQHSFSSVSLSIHFDCLQNKDLADGCSALLREIKNNNGRLFASLVLEPELSFDRITSSMERFFELFREYQDTTLSFSVPHTEQGASPYEIYNIAAKISQAYPHPLLLRMTFSDPDEALIQGSLHAGGLLASGIGHGIMLECSPASGEFLQELSLDILQSARLRINKAEFISCPSCGRTLFDLQTTTQRIREKTGHLKGVKIAVMGCIVNGPGEMADADFGYVGAGPGKIHLYRGKEIVEKNIPSETADERLIELIQSSGMWTEKEASAQSTVR